MGIQWKSILRGQPGGTFGVMKSRGTKGGEAKWGRGDTERAKLGGVKHGQKTRVMENWKSERTGLA